MNCQDTCEFLDAYIDNELDLIAIRRCEDHLSECASCQKTYAQHREMQDVVKSKLERFHASEGFEQRLRSRLAGSGEQETTISERHSPPPWKTLALAASFVVVLLSAFLLGRMLTRTSDRELLAQQVVSSHIRSLQAAHLNDVISTDQHTVKPWFSGKLDFAPVIKDLSPDGFSLAGGRLDYLDDRPVAALVYKRRQHTINLFEWPSQNSDSNPHTLSVRGYNVITWSHSHLTYWAVSDVNAADLADFAAKIAR